MRFSRLRFIFLVLILISLTVNSSNMGNSDVADYKTYTIREKIGKSILNNTYLYVKGYDSSQNSELICYDISNTSALNEISSINVNVSQFAIDNELIYIQNETGLSIFDYSDPTSPVFLSNFSFVGELINVKDYVVFYKRNNITNEIMQLLDATDPNNIGLLGNCSIPELSWEEIYDFSWSTHITYKAVRILSLTIQLEINYLDLQNPIVTNIVNHIKFEIHNEYGHVVVRVVDGFLYFPTGSLESYFKEISYDVVGGISVNNMIYALDSDNGIESIKIVNPEKPKFSGFFNYTGGSSLFYFNDSLFVINNEKGEIISIRILDFPYVSYFDVDMIGWLLLIAILIGIPISLILISKSKMTTSSKDCIGSIVIIISLYAMIIIYGFGIQGFT